MMAWRLSTASTLSRRPGFLLFLFTLMCGLVSAQDSDADALGTVLAEYKELSTYYKLIKKYPDILLRLPNTNGVTIIAPNNDAFKNIPFTVYNDVWDENNSTLVTNVLLYHVLQGSFSLEDLPKGESRMASSLLTNRAFTNVTTGQNVLFNKGPDDSVVVISGQGTRISVTYSDITFSGGRVHIIDNLLVLPQALYPVRTTYPNDLPAFVGALYAADLMPALQARPNLTFFAPRPPAFARVNASLHALDAAGLAAVMRYHVVPGVLGSDKLTNGTALATLPEKGGQGGGDAAKLHITRNGNQIFVDSAQVVQPDILLANGVLHLVDNVLNPQAPSARPDPDLATQAPVFAPDSATTTGRGRPMSTPMPFTTALPCSTNCPVTASANGTATEAVATDTASTSLKTSKSKDAAGARCTGLGGLVGVGFGIGVLGAAGLV